MVFVSIFWCILIFALPSEWYSAEDPDDAPLRAGQRTVLRETFDLSQPAPLTRIHTAVLGEAESQLPLPHTPRSNRDKPQGESELIVLHPFYLFSWHVFRKIANVFEDLIDSPTLLFCMEQKMIY